MSGRLLLHTMAKAAMMRHALCVHLILVLTVTVFAQTATKSKPQPALTEKPISKYMREVGLLYLEQIEDFEHDCERGWEECRSSLDRWDRVFRPLEDRITISLSEPGRAEGDKPFFELLKHAKTSTNSFLYENHFYEKKEEDEEIRAKGGLPNGGLPDTGPPLAEQREIMEAWLRISRACRYYAHTFSLDGTYLSPDSCEDEYARQIRKDLDRSNPQKAPDMQPSEKLTGEEAKARSWHTQAYCEKDGYVWKDGVCHAKK